MIKVYLNGKALRYLIKMRNMKHKEVADRLGITHIHFSRLLSGRHEPTPKVRKALVNIFRGQKWDRLFTIYHYTDTAFGGFNDAI